MKKIKTYLFRKENLFFVLVPLIILEGILFDIYSFNIEPRFSFSNWVTLMWKSIIAGFLKLSLQWLIFLAIPYSLHSILRYKAIGNKLICSAHIYTSIIILAIWFIVPQFSTSNIPGWHTTLFPSPFIYMQLEFWKLDIVAILFLIIQIAFIIYAGIILSKKNPLFDG
ncbi:MAG TPA: hypothetical protein PLP23_08585 [Panacibacter sp.]|nr:hypothetical protein [Panacibacter sp.]